MCVYIHTYERSELFLGVNLTLENFIRGGGRLKPAACVQLIFSHIIINHILIQPLMIIVCKCLRMCMLYSTS